MPLPAPPRDATRLQRQLTAAAQAVKARTKPARQRLSLVALALRSLFQLAVLYLGRNALICLPRTAGVGEGFSSGHSGVQQAADLLNLAQDWAGDGTGLFGAAA